jgi:hypothetical protein
LVALAVAAVVLLAACGGPAVTPNDGLDPILIRGKLVDAKGTPVPAQAGQITLADHASARPGEPITVIYQAKFFIAIDGSFEVRVPVTPEIAAFAGRTDHVASFDMFALGADGNVVANFTFSRTVDQDRWAGDVPYLTLRSDGVSELDEHPAQQ